MHIEPNQYEDLVDRLKLAGRALADSVGVVPIAFPDGGNTNNGGAGANAVGVSRLILVLTGFAKEVEEVLKEIERPHFKRVAPGDPVRGDES